MLNLTFLQSALKTTDSRLVLEMPGVQQVHSEALSIHNNDLALDSLNPSTPLCYWYCQQPIPFLVVADPVQFD